VAGGILEFYPFWNIYYFSNVNDTFLFDIQGIGNEVRHSNLIIEYSHDQNAANEVEALSVM
jgi:hypothetical protein